MSNRQSSGWWGSGWKCRDPYGSSTGVCACQRPNVGSMFCHRLKSNIDRSSDRVVPAWGVCLGYGLRTSTAERPAHEWLKVCHTLRERFYAQVDTQAATF